MIKRSLFFSQPVYLRKKEMQLEAVLENRLLVSAPIEDLGFVILDDRQIRYSQGLISSLLEHNVSVIHCNDRHMPAGLMLNLDAHHLQQEIHRSQIEAKLPARKALWKQIVEQKITNQIAVIELLQRPVIPMLRAARTQVRSDDSSNREAVAAKLYWKAIMPPGFVRARANLLANKLLNYGYAILRAAVARALTGSGLLPTIGIHHRNQYNSFALADDVMEPYRPFIDWQVLQMQEACLLENKELKRSHKQKLLEALTMDTKCEGKNRPLINALSLTSASLARYFHDNSQKVVFPLV